MNYAQWLPIIAAILGYAAGAAVTYWQMSSSERAYNEPLRSRVLELLAMIKEEILAARYIRRHLNVRN